MTSILDTMSRVERLRKMVELICSGKEFSAFDLAVEFRVSVNVIYRDIATLRGEKLIPDSFKFAKKIPGQFTPLSTS